MVERRRRGGGQAAGDASGAWADLQGRHDHVRRPILVLSQERMLELFRYDRCEIPTMRAKLRIRSEHRLIDPTGQRTTGQDHQRRHQIADIQLPAVTFERAGTGVRTHIVVLEKQTNKDKLNTVPQQISLDYSDAENINTCSTGSRMHLSVLARTPGRKSPTPTKAPSVGAGVPRRFVRMAGRRPSRRCCRAGNCSPTRQDHVHDEGRQEDRRRDCQNADEWPGDSDRPIHVAKGRRVFIRIKHVVRPESNNETRYNLAAGIQATPADRAVHDMAQEGKSAAEASSNSSAIQPAAVQSLSGERAEKPRGIVNDHTDSQGGWRFGNTSRAQKYAAPYNSRTDTVALSTAREAGGTSCMSWCTRPR